MIDFDLGQCGRAVLPGSLLCVLSPQSLAGRLGWTEGRVPPRVQLIIGAPVTLQHTMEVSLHALHRFGLVQAQVAQ